MSIRSLEYKCGILEPKPGAHIDDCKAHSIAMATINRGQVQFVHNGQTWVVDKDGNITQIYDYE